MEFRSEKTYRHFNIIFDYGYKDLINMAKQTPAFVERGKKQIFTYYQGVDVNGLVTFITPSGTTPGKFWLQRVLLVDLKPLIKKFSGKKKDLEIVRLAIAGTLKMSCNDPEGGEEPSWKYWGFQYKASVSGYNEGTKELRFPKIRNPKLQGSVCKHLRMVLESLPFHATVITKDLKKVGVFE